MFSLKLKGLKFVIISRVVNVRVTANIVQHGHIADTNSTLAGCKPLPLKPLFCTGLVTYMKNEPGPNQMKDTYPLSNTIVDSGD